jgi:hypothetical protein
MASDWEKILSAIISDVPVRLPWQEYMVHIGKSYFVKNIYEFPAQQNETFELLVRVRGGLTNLPYAGWLFRSNKEITFEIYEDIEVQADGEGILTQNHNRNAPALPTGFEYSIYIGPTYTEPSGDPMYKSMIDELDPETQLGKPQMVGKVSTDYLFRFTKTLEAGAWLDYYIWFYLR